MLISGVADAGYDGWFQVTGNDAGSFSFTVTSTLPTETGAFPVQVIAPVQYQNVSPLTQTGGTAKAYVTDNYTTGDELMISGADQAGYDGCVTVTGTGSDGGGNYFTYAVPSGTPATASGTVRVRLVGSDETQTTYDRLGRTVTTTDQQGVVHTYLYDSAGRQYADDVTTLPAGVDGAVRAIVTGYDDMGRVQTVTSYNTDVVSDWVPGNVVNEVEDAYDGWGNLAQEWQSNSGPVDTSSTPPTPSVQYTYDDGAGATGVAQYVRLSTVTYPSQEVLQYTYGDSGSLSDVLSRVDQIEPDVEPVATPALSSWTVAQTGGGSAAVTGSTFQWQASASTDTATLGATLTRTAVAGATYTLTFAVNIADGGSYELQPELLFAGSDVLQLSPLTITSGGTLTFQYAAGTGGQSIGIEFAFTQASGADVEAFLSDVTLTEGVAAAAYTYLGTGTIASENYEQPQIKLDYSASNFAALDQFGRVLDQFWSSYGATPSTNEEYKYTYDEAGNVLTRTNVNNSALNCAVHLRRHEPADELVSRWGHDADAVLDARLPGQRPERGHV